MPELTKITAVYGVTKRRLGFNIRGRKWLFQPLLFSDEVDQNTSYPIDPYATD
ncbi:hypothetical protein [Nafulsella turpanensis]|uniref:hypothetical protein n=1 Tax=Nafulsella turpanensis TaxID=1265690 RepID=UPI00034A9E39|nr:hypothetical protein [Nafulsella turpanensis]